MQAIKGFIELTLKNAKQKILININQIRDVTSNSVVCFDNEYHYSVEEEYEEIKELIKNAL